MTPRSGWARGSAAEGGVVIFEFPGSWIVGFGLALLGTLMFLDAGRLASKTILFMDKSDEKAGHVER